MIDDRVAELARHVRCDRPPSMPPNEITSFDVNDDGSVFVHTASGEKLHVLRRCALHPDVMIEHAVLAEDLLRKLQLLTFGVPLRRGATYVRRVIIAGEGECRGGFIEAGR
jgi:hypothetical protein